MSTNAETIEVKVERTIPASPEAVYDAWLDPQVPGTPWHESGKLILNAEVDGLFYWAFKPTGTPHFGRFTELDRPRRLQYSWMSPNTLGRETTVTVSLVAKGDATVFSLVHANLPDTSGGKSHANGWTYFLEQFEKHLSQPAS